MDRDAQFFRQPCHAVPQFRRRFVRRFGGVGQFLQGQGTLPLPEAAQVGASVQRRADKPGSDVLLVPVHCLLAEQAQEHILVDILGIRRILQATQSQAVYRIPMDRHGIVQLLLGQRQCLLSFI